MDDFLSCAAVPKRKGANFRDLPGVHTWGNGAARSLLFKQRPLGVMDIMDAM